MKKPDAEALDRESMLRALKGMSGADELEPMDDPEEESAESEDDHGSAITIIIGKAPMKGKYK